MDEWRPTALVSSVRRAMTDKAKCWKTTLTLHGLHKATRPRKRHWEEMAHYRSGWRTAVKTAKAERTRATDAKIKRQRRHERALALANRTNQHPEFACRYCGRKLGVRIGQLSLERAGARKR